MSMPIVAIYRTVGNPISISAAYCFQMICRTQTEEVNAD